MTALTETTGDPAATAAHAARGGRWIDHWEPDNDGFWAQTGKRIARRNLVWSIVTEHLGFCVWLLWSIAVLNLPKVGVKLSVGELLWLTTTPNLVGAAMRIPYTFAPAKFGGRNWTIVSALLLFLPCGLFVYAIQNPGLPFGVLLLIAATTGLGGGNFASSMSNITHFYPTGKQGLPLGLNAAGGNIGVSVTQLAMPPLIVGFGLVAVGLVWMPLILIAAVGAYFFMNNLRHASSAYTVKEMWDISKRPQTVIMSILYIGTFGSFIGYSFSFGVLIKSQFPDIKAANYIWLGALVGSAARPLGGWLADRLGGARVTFWNFLAMGSGIVAVAVAVDAKSWPLFLAAFLWVFVTTGIGNGSTYKMIPAIFKTQALEDVNPADEAAVATATTVGRRNAAAAIGISSAVGAFGGVLIQQAFRISIEQTASIGSALIGLAVFYSVCVSLTWFCYMRRSVAVRLVPSLAGAGI